jgi:hypothetical protein
MQLLALVGIPSIDREDVVLGGEQLIGRIKSPVRIVVSQARGVIQPRKQVRAHPKAADLEIPVAEVLVVGEPHVGRRPLNRARRGWVHAGMGQETGAGRPVSASLGIQLRIDPSVSGHTERGLR